MRDKAFLDTNVLVYAYDTREPTRQAKAQALIEGGLRHESVVLSTQVLGEFFVGMTRRVQPPLKSEEVSEILDSLAAIPVLGIDLLMVRRAIDTNLRYGTSYWDSLILAAAERGGCKILYSEDLNEGQEYHGVRVVNPFRA